MHDHDTFDPFRASPGDPFGSGNGAGEDDPARETSEQRVGDADDRGPGSDDGRTSPLRAVGASTDDVASDSSAGETSQDGARRATDPGDSSGADFADGAQRTLDPHFVPAERVGYIISEVVLDVFMVLLLGLAALFGWFSTWVLWTLIAIAALLVVLLRLMTMRMPSLVYANTRWAVSPLGMEIRRGIVWKHVIDVPRSRVQHTDVSQGPLQRRFGIARLTLHTAGTQHASVELTGLERDLAYRVRDYLLRGSDDDSI